MHLSIILAFSYHFIIAIATNRTIRKSRLGLQMRQEQKEQVDYGTMTSSA